MAAFWSLMPGKMSFRPAFRGSACVASDSPLLCGGRELEIKRTNTLVTISVNMHDNIPLGTPFLG